jgi:hypothetical protein
MATKKDSIKFSTEKLLKSRALSEYQPDFAKVILTKSEYSIEEAKAVLSRALKKGVK